MTPDMIIKLKRSLVEHEDRTNFPYVDTVGKITIGIGYNLTDRGLPDSWVDSQFQQDVDYFYQELMQFPWFQHLNDDRKIAIIDMSFMGIKRLLSFKKMIAALLVEDYKLASEEMLNSKWALQVKSRATDLAEVILNGVYKI